MLFCEFRLNLTQTSSHDWHVQLFVKDPLRVRTGRPLRIMTAHNLAVLSVVLETFQTYYAFSRAVNPSISIDTGSTGRSTLESRSVSPRKHGGHGTRLTSKFRAFRSKPDAFCDSRVANAQYAAPACLEHKTFSAQRHQSVRIR